MQQAYLTAKALGVADRAHDAMYDAIWQLGGELSITDSLTGRIKKELPTLADAGKFYARVTGVAAEKFVLTANSFGIAREMQRFDERIKQLQVDSAPTIAVNGKFVASPGSAGGDAQLVSLVQWLVAREARVRRKCYRPRPADRL